MIGSQSCFAMVSSHSGRQLVQYACRDQQLTAVYVPIKENKMLTAYSKSNLGRGTGQGYILIFFIFCVLRYSDFPADFERCSSSPAVWRKTESSATGHPKNRSHVHANEIPLCVFRQRNHKRAMEEN